MEDTIEACWHKENDEKVELNPTKHHTCTLVYGPTFHYLGMNVTLP